MAGLVVENVAVDVPSGFGRDKLCSPTERTNYCIIIRQGYNNNPLAASQGYDNNPLTASQGYSNNTVRYKKFTGVCSVIIAGM